MQPSTKAWEGFEALTVMSTTAAIDESRRPVRQLAATAHAHHAPDVLATAKAQR